jgi:hypothetical protein
LSQVRVERDRAREARLKDDHVLNAHVTSDRAVNTGAGIGRLDRVSQRNTIAGAQAIRQAGDCNRREQDAFFQTLTLRRDERVATRGRRAAANTLLDEPASPQEKIEYPILAGSEQSDT